MDNGLPTIAAFNVELLDALDKLRKTWNRNIDKKLRPSFPVDDYIEEIRKAAENNILFRAGMSLNRLNRPNRGDIYEGDISKFVTDLINTDYIRNPEKLKFVKLSAGEGTDERKESLKFLNEFANHVGRAIDSRYNPARRTGIAPTQPAWAKTGLIPTEHVVTQPENVTSFRDTVSNQLPSERSGVTLSYVPSDDLTDTNPSWGIEGTPKPDTIDDLKDLRTEAADFAEMVIKAIYSDQLRLQIETKLKPRLETVKRELETRYSDLDETSRAIFNQPLIDFRDSLATFIQQGLARADLLEQKALNAPTTKASNTLAQREDALRSRINAFIEKSQGAELQKLLDTRLMPKSLALKEEITALRKSGADIEAIFEKVRNLRVIQDSMAAVTSKLDTERAARAFVEKIVTPVIAPAALVATPLASPIISRKPPADQYVPTLTEVIEDPRELPSKVAFLAPTPQDLMNRTLLPTQAESTVAKKPVGYYSKNVTAFFKETELKEAENNGNAVSGGALLLGSSGSEENLDGFAPVEFLAKSRPIAISPTPAANDRRSFKDIFNKKAVAKIGGIFLGAAAAVAALGTVITLTLSSGDALDKALAESVMKTQPTAQAATQAVKPQPTVIVAAATVANDVASAPVAAEVVAPAPTPEPTIEAAPVAPTVSAKTPTIVKHFVANAKTKAVEPTVNVQNNEPIVEKTWDIATSRVDLETWNNACKALNQQNLTVNGVCPS